MKAFLDTFFTGLGIQVDSLELKEEGDDLSVRVQTPDSSLLIGMHGKNIEAIQHLLWRIAEKKLAKFIHVHLEVNDYIKSKDERLFRFIESKLSLLMSTGKSLQIPSLSSFERKKAHNYIAEKNIEWLTTKSEWEAANRMLVLAYTGVPTISTTLSIQKPSTKSTPSLSSHDTLSEDGVGI